MAGMRFITLDSIVPIAELSDSPELIILADDAKTWFVRHLYEAGQLDGLKAWERARLALGGMSIFGVKDKRSAMGLSFCLGHMMNRDWYVG